MKAMNEDDARAALKDLGELPAHEIHPLLRRDFKRALESVIALQEERAAMLDKIGECDSDGGCRAWAFAQRKR